VQGNVKGRNESTKERLGRRGSTMIMNYTAWTAGHASMWPDYCPRSVGKQPPARGDLEPVRPPRDFAAMEARRMRAADMSEAGEITKAEIARRVGVAHQTVSDWHELCEQRGWDALRATGRAARLAKLNATQLAKVEEALLKGAKANRYDNGLWT